MKNSPDDIALKRSVLLGARVRFSPSGTIIRQQAIERIIEQNLALEEAPGGLTEHQLRALTTLEGRMPVLRASDVRVGLKSLMQSGRVEEIKVRGKSRYALSKKVRDEVHHALDESERRNRDVINSLFATAPGGPEHYEKAFLRLLCIVFSELSETYVQVITRGQSPMDLVGHSFLSSSIDKVLEYERVPSAEAFRYGANRFFRESSPNFDQLKWNMTQNFYIMKALGIDSASDLLSADIFRGASLYCDTNVLIPGLMPSNRHHNSFQELAKACEAIGMQLKVTHNTVEELNAVINHHASLIRQVGNNIPNEMQLQIRDFLFGAYIAEKADSPDLSLDEFVIRFQKPVQTLRDSFGLIEEDDEWFDVLTEDQATKRIAEDLIRQHVKMRGRPKAEKAAIHDAVLLQWVARENADNHKSWLVTLDLTLAEWYTQSREKNFRVITLDALLQWITPMVPGSTDEEKLAGIFAEAIRYHLLPKDTFFELRDFQVFAEMGIETQQLPADDVKACIREIKTVAPYLDPSKAEDREKMGRVIQRYFADPGTKYKRTIDELKKQITEETNLRKQHEKKIRDLEERIKNVQKRDEHRILVRSAIRRSLLSFGMLVIMESVISWLIWRYGEGGNLFQKVANSWDWLMGGFSVVAFLYPFILGRERLRLLKWWKGD